MCIDENLSLEDAATILLYYEGDALYENFTLQEIYIIIKVIYDSFKEK